MIIVRRKIGVRIYIWKKGGYLGKKRGGVIIVSEGHGRVGRGFGLKKENWNNGNKRKSFPEKSNPRVRKAKHSPLLFFAATTADLAVYLVFISPTSFPTLTLSARRPHVEYFSLSLPRWRYCPCHSFWVFCQNILEKIIVRKYIKQFKNYLILFFR